MTGGAKVHAYPMRALTADYLRAGIGLGLSLLMILLGHTGSAVTALLAGVAALFAIHGLNTATRHKMRLTVGEDAIVFRGWRRVGLSWKDMTEFKLSYYSTARARDRRAGDRRGWMQLRLKGKGVTIRLDSSLDGFEKVARRAAAAAQTNGIAIDPTSLSNLDALGTEG